jgi:hypothetical protein
MSKDTITSDPQGVFVVDDTAFPKKSKDSVCVARQYCGSTGKVDNCQIGVSLTYVGHEVAWPYVMDLFVPESWDKTQNPQCRAKRNKTHMPETHIIKKNGVWHWSRLIWLELKESLIGLLLPTVGTAILLSSGGGWWNVRRTMWLGVLEHGGVS